MKKLIILPLLLAVLISTFVVAGQYDAYKPDFRAPRWDVKINAFIDQVSTLYDYCHTTLAGALSTLSSAVSNLSSLVTNWVTTENYLIYCTATPTRVDGDTFTVPGDLTTTFSTNRIIHAYCGTDGMIYSKVVSSSYGGGITTVELNSSGLTTNLVHVFFVASRDGLSVAQSGQVFAADYGSPGQAAFDAAIAAIGVNNRTLVLGPGTWSITADTTVPANVCVSPHKGAVFDVATTKTLTINGPITAGPYQIFSWTGSGKVTLVARTEVPVEWWGAVADNSTDCQPAIQAALNALSTGGVVRLGVGIYKLDSFNTVLGAYHSLVWPEVNGIALIGQGMGATSLRGKDHASTDYNIIQIKASGAGGISNVRISGITFRGEADQASVPAMGIYVNDYVYDLEVENCEFKWLRGAAIRFSATNHGARNTIENCYLHDIMTSGMTTATGSAGGIAGSAPKTKFINNRIIDIGKGDAGSTWHSIYALNTELLISGNYIEGRGLHVRSDSAAYSNIRIIGNRIKNTDTADRTCYIGSATGGYKVSNLIMTDNLFDGFTVLILADHATVANNLLDGSAYGYIGGYLSLDGTDITATGNTIIGSDTKNLATGIRIGGIYNSSNILVEGNQISKCSKGVYLPGKSAPTTVCTNIVIQDNKISGGASIDSGWVALDIPTTADVTKLKFNNNFVSDLFYLADIRVDVGPTQINQNTVRGVTAGLLVLVDPISELECIGTAALDSTFTTPFNYSYLPTATRIFRMCETRALSNNGSVALANSATPKVWLGKTFVTGGTTTITNLQGGCVGDTIYILGAHSVTIDSEANTDDGYIKLAGGDYSMTAGKVLVLHQFVQGCWQGVGN